MRPETKENLSRLARGRVRFEAPLADLTTFGLGGPAAALVEPDSIEELSGVLDFVRTEGLPLFILGGGSNVLVLDGGYPGVVLRLGPGFGQLSVRGPSGKEVRVEAGAAAPTSALVALTRREGLSGLEFLAGIPGWVGGALAMNAGGYGGQITQAVLGLTLIRADGRIEEVDREGIKASYRSLELPEGAVILKALFSLVPVAPETVSRRVEEILAKRQASLPRGVKSAGCIFKNPPGRPAGRLIDQTGLKGLRAGQAWVAEEHANFIVHQGRATATEVIELIETVRAAVRDKFDVDLETEIKIIGQGRETESR